MAGVDGLVAVAVLQLFVDVGRQAQASRSILALRAEDVKREEENMSKVVDENLSLIHI